MITLFATPKSFEDRHIATIQQNAVGSWIRMDPTIQIILMGDEPGVARICDEYGIRHIKEVATSGYGTPLLNDLFEKAEHNARYDILCYINADIILTQDFIQALKHVRDVKHPFLISGGRWGLKIGEEVSFDDGWETELRTLARTKGSFAFMGNDYFVFSRGLYGNMPPLTVGRGYFDAWLFSQARARGAFVIDASQMVMPIHQDHHYEHLQSGDDPWRSEEGLGNLEFVGSSRHWYLREATHELTPRGLRRVRGRKLRYVVGSFFIYRLGPLRHRLGIRRATLDRARSVLKFGRPRRGPDNREMKRES